MSPRLLTRDNTEDTLKTMLEEAGLTLDRLDLEKAWDVFIEFCKIPIVTETDGVLVQWGPYGALGEKFAFQEDRSGFYFSVLRQFDDGNMEFEQLTLEWNYLLNDSLVEFLGQTDHENSDWCFAELGCDHEGFLRIQQQGELFQFFKRQKPLQTSLFQENTG